MSSASPAAQSQELDHTYLHAHSASTASEASSVKHLTKPTRPHLVSRHSRNVSHQYRSQAHANNMPPKKSMSQVYSDNTGRHHRRAKSGATTPSASPRTNPGTHMKRNSSHVVLPKNRSAANLRKNQSATTLTALNRNGSKGALNKLGAPAEQKAKQAAQQKQGVFDMGDDSSEDEEEAEWEDSTASPELTRNNTRNNSASNSKVATPARPQTPMDQAATDSPDVQPTALDQRTSSPPEPSVLKGNKSAPDLRFDGSSTFNRPRHDPTLLTQTGRASRAPPAMTTANAHSSQQNIPRNSSQHSLLRSGQTSLEMSQDTIEAASISKTTNSTTGPASSSGSAGVSHFLPNDGLTSGSRGERKIPPKDDDDDDDGEASVSDFMATYRPQASESPERPKTNFHTVKLPNQPSRTQQKLELQRREVMRGSGAPASSSTGLALSVGSSVSLHSRSASKGRARNMPGEPKAVKQDYENAVRQLTIVRRFRNPIIESVARIKHHQPQASESIPVSPHKQDQKRPSSRRGQSAKPRPASVVDAMPATPPSEQPKSHAFRPGQGRDGRVTFQLSRQGSHEDMLKTASSSIGAQQDAGGEDISSEGALIRRMWESRIQIHVA